MIVKIWPIKGAHGIKNAMLYIQDDNKVIKVEKDDDGRVTRRKIIDPEVEFRKDADSFFIENEEDIDRVLSYMSDTDKIKNKFISGYLCSPENALESFRDNWAQITLCAGPEKKPKNMKRENMAYHMVQSFPEELDITDEEVHQCGLELLQKIGDHQGVVCSHVHPVVDEEGKQHGRCKHNHILFNAFIQADKIDPQRPQRVKYHDCKETYEQLQIWNDEIAIEHGLPIIRNPDPERVYSWKESYETQHGRSWKDRIRMDIEAARSMTKNWTEFKTLMEQDGYSIRIGAHTSYTAPDGEHKIRAGKLGQSYTKENLELYWAIRSRTERAVEKAVKDNAAPPLWAVAQQYGQLIVQVPIGTKKGDNPPSYSLPLDKSSRTRKVLSTYFNEKDIYDVYDGAGRVVAAATGQELVDYLDDLNRNHDALWLEMAKRNEEEQQQLWQQQEDRRRRAAEEEKKKNIYTYRFRNSRTKQYYYTDLRDENGRRRSSIELIFLLARVVLESEDGLWEHRGKFPAGKDNEAVLGRTDWKIQNMMDSIHLATEEGIKTPAQLDQRLHETGAAYSRARTAFQKTKRAQEKMAALNDALNEYEDTRELAERIQALPEGPEKTKLQDQYHDLLARYKKAKAIMYGYRVTEQTAIDDFRMRYADIQKNLPDMQEEYDRTKEEYSRLKKLQYNVKLAQSEEYCYGPEYHADPSFDWKDLRQKEANEELAEHEENSADKNRESEENQNKIRP